MGLIQEYTERDQQQNTEVELYHVHATTKTKGNESLKVNLQIENTSVLMEVDSGACKSVIHVEDYNKMLSHLDLDSIDFKLKVVPGENVL